MKVSCPSCQAKYNIADDKVKGKKVKVRCKSCGTQILVDGNASPVSSAPPDEQATDAASALTSDSPPVPEIPEPETPNAWTVNFSDNDERSLTTAEIAEMAVQGQLPDEVFVWKEGMDDWQLVTSVPELSSAIAAARKRAHGAGPSQKPPKIAEKAGAAKQETSASNPPSAPQDTSAGPIVAAPGSALAKKMASAKSAAAQKKTAAAEAAKQESRDEPAAGGAESPAAPKAATKVATKRQTGTHDLFAAVDRAGSEIDVVTEPESRDAATKATGARNENSVLFSLDALKSGMLGGATSPAAENKPAPAGPGPRRKAPGPPAKRLEDLMAVDVGSGPTLGRGGGGLLLSGNDALLAAPPPPPPKPEPKPVSVAPAASGVDVAAAPPPKSRLGLFIGLAIGLVALGAGGSFLLMKSSASQPGPEASASAVAAASASAVAAKSAAPAASSAPTEVAKNETPDSGAAVAAASASAPTGAAAQPAAVAKVGSGVTGKSGTGKSGSSETKPPEKEKKEPKAEPAPAPGGGGGFNKDAAVAALSVAASQATVCKRPEGPWGSGRAVVTFASSGRVTTANVTGEPFGGTAVGGCVASVFRRAKIPPFSGDPVTVSKSFTIAP